MNWVQDLVESYYSFLKSTTFTSVDAKTGWAVINSPLYDAMNDSIDIYVKQDGNKILLSDDGNTVANLDLLNAGISRSTKRKALLNYILSNYGVAFHNSELCIETDIKSFPQKMNNLMAAISETNDLYFTANKQPEYIFRDDVESYLTGLDIVYTPHFIAKGELGLEFSFDFQIAYPKHEIVIKAFNSLNTLNIPHFLYTWKDIKKSRQRQAKKEVIGLAIINDQNERSPKPEYIEAMAKEDTRYCVWSDRFKRENIDFLRMKAM